MTVSHPIQSHSFEDLKVINKALNHSNRTFQTLEQTHGTINKFQITNSILLFSPFPAVKIDCHHVTLLPLPPISIKLIALYIIRTVSDSGEYFFEISILLYIFHRFQGMFRYNLVKIYERNHGKILNAIIIVITFLQRNIITRMVIAND
jgi:hypothetical protein